MLSAFWHLVAADAISGAKILLLGTRRSSPGRRHAVAQGELYTTSTSASSGVGGDSGQFWPDQPAVSGALLQLAVTAVGSIMPYITLSIIVQLLGVVIPRFEQLRKEDKQGETKMTQYRYLAIALAMQTSASSR